MWEGGEGVGEGESQSGRREMSAFFSQATSFEICFDQDQTLSGCQKGSTHVNCKSISLGMIIAS